MDYSSLFLVFLANVLAVFAFPVQLDQAESNQSQGWNKEAIFALIGLFLAVIAIIAMVILASPSAHRWCAGIGRDTALRAMEGPAWQEYMEAKKKTLVLRKKWEESIKPQHVVLG